jgi:hypothetical protein
MAQVNDDRVYVQAFDTFMVPSLSEGMTMTLLDAMGFKPPCSGLIVSVY